MQLCNMQKRWAYYAMIPRSMSRNIYSSLPIHWNIIFGVKNTLTLSYRMSDNETKLSNFLLCLNMKLTLSEQRGLPSPFLKQLNFQLWKKGPYFCIKILITLSYVKNYFFFKYTFFTLQYHFCFLSLKGSNVSSS